MSHPINPISLRLGKTFLWKNNEISSFENKQKLFNQKINSAAGLEQVIGRLLKKQGLYVLRSSIKVKAHSGITNVKVLYYPLFKPNLRRRFFPKYSTKFWGVVKKVNYIKPIVKTKDKNSKIKSECKFRNFLKHIWNSKLKRFKNRFLIRKPYKKLTPWIIKRMFKYSKKKYLVKKKGWKKKWLLINKTRAKLRKKKNKKKIKNKAFENMLTNKIGTRVRFKGINTFEYLIKKFKHRNWLNKLFHIWEKQYHKNKYKISNFYDVVNILYLACYIPGTESLIVKIIQYSLLRLHKRKIRIKPFFYFINAVLRDMARIKLIFKVFKIVITGKIRGGTARTKVFKIGFGNRFPQQSLSKKINYSFGDIKSKYGSFGVKVITQRY